MTTRRHRRFTVPLNGILQGVGRGFFPNTLIFMDFKDRLPVFNLFPSWEQPGPV